MIDLRQLEQLVTIAEKGTISKAAEELKISQPALSRSMQNLEEDLNISLFEHHKNKVILNETGNLLVTRAKTILNNVAKMVEEVKAFDLANHSISIACCSPAPIWDLIPVIKQFNPAIEISSKVLDQSVLEDVLLTKQYSIVITLEKINNPAVISIPYLDEDISLSLPLNHKLADRKEVSYADLEGETMLLYSTSGVWYERHLAEMPKTKFILQPERDSFTEIVKSSTLPCFTSNLTLKREGKPENRIIIPFTDESAHVTFYLNVLKEKRSRYQQLLDVIDNYYDY